VTPLDWGVAPTATLAPVCVKVATSALRFVPIGTVALIVTTMGVTVTLIFHALTRGTRLDFLFVRPAMFQLGATRKAPLQPAE
jgi:hypothetical protein